MYTRQNYSQILSELEDETDEMKMMLEFYKHSLPFLVSVTHIEYRIIRTMAVRLQATDLFESDWRAFANEMGITGNYQLAELQVCARVRMEQPIFLAITLVIRCYGFGKVIKALINTQRHDILRELEPYVQGLCNTSQQSTGSIYSTGAFHTCSSASGVASPRGAPYQNVSGGSFHPTMSKPKCNVGAPVTRGPHIIDTAVATPLSPEKPDVELDKTVKDLDDAVDELVDTVQELQKNEQIPSAPPDHSISVLIPHTDLESDIDHALRLSQKLREAGMIVRTLLDLDLLLMINSTSTLNTTFQEVDFIVPVVSRRYLKQIRPQNHETYLDSPYTMNNKHLYELMMNEYRNVGCDNFRVRAVLAPGMERQWVTRDVIMSASFKLWSEMPKLIHVLKKSKQQNLPSFVR